MIRESRLVGAHLGGSLRDVTLTACQLDLASLRMAKLARVEFHACTLVEAEACAAEFTSTLFAACDLTNADLTAATFERSDFERCTLAGNRSIESLRGTRIPLTDLLLLAPLLVDALGIEPT